MKKKGVIIKCGVSVEDIQEGLVITSQQRVSSQTIIWAAGVRPLPVADWLKVKADKRGAVTVTKNLSVEGLPNVFVLGDSATFLQNGQPLPALASVAKQQGKYLANYLRHHVRGKKYKAFHYRNYGVMATIGRNGAVAAFGSFSLKGWLAWISWGIVHIYFLTGFRNRMAVFLLWVWTYITYGMGARILLREEEKRTPPFIQS